MPAELEPHIKHEAPIPVPDTRREGEFAVPERNPVPPAEHGDSDVLAALADADVPAASVPAKEIAPAVQRVESILADGLEETYKGLDPATQAEFRAKGEETAASIAAMLAEAKVKVRSIIKLITDWLKIIPGVSKFFLEQEAKIKTDRLLGLRRDTEE